MKRVRWIGCLLALMGPLLADTLPVQEEKTQVIRLLDLDGGMMQSFLEGKQRDWIVEFPEGSYFPFKFKILIKGEFLNLEAVETSVLDLRVLKPCYVRCEGENQFLFSADRQQWKEFEEFFTGALRMSFVIEEDHKSSQLGVELELNQRKEDHSQGPS